MFYLHIYYAFLFFGYICAVNNLQAHLNGRTGNFPIEVDNTYSFSNGEYALGYVKFENGFDVPTNGTVILGVNKIVNGPINFNNGTIILEKNITLGNDVTFNGDGYIKTNGNTIFLQGPLNLFDNYFFSDQVIFNGLGTGFLACRIGSHLLITENTIAFIHMNILLNAANRIVFNGVDDRIVELSHVTLSIISGDFNVDRLNIAGICSLEGQIPTYTVLDTVFVGGGARLTIDTFMQLSTPQIILDQREAEVVLSNATMVFTNTPTTDYAIDRVGKFFIEGQSIFKTLNTELIDVHPGIKLLIRNGSRLELESGLHLKIN